MSAIKASDKSTNCRVGFYWFDHTWLYPMTKKSLHRLGLQEYRDFQRRHPSVSQRREVSVGYLFKFRYESDKLYDYIWEHERLVWGEAAVRSERSGITRRPDRGQAGPTLLSAPDSGGVLFGPWAGDVFRGLSDDIVIVYAVRGRDDAWLDMVLRDCLLPLMQTTTRDFARTIVFAIRDGHPTFTSPHYVEDAVALIRRVFKVDITAGDD